MGSSSRSAKDFGVLSDLELRVSLKRIFPRGAMATMCDFVYAQMRKTVQKKNKSKSKRQK